MKREGGEREATREARGKHEGSKSEKRARREGKGREKGGKREDIQGRKRR